MSEAPGRLCIPTFLAVFTTLGLFALIFVLVFRMVPEESRSIFEILLGAVVTQWSAVMGYYFGSSSGSAAKSKAIETMVADGSESGDAQRLSDEALLAYYAGLQSAMDGRKIEDNPYKTKEAREAFEKGFREYETKMKAKE
jgi:ribosome modulation factor